MKASADQAAFRVAIQGRPYSNSHAAAAILAPGAEIKYCDRSEEVFEAVTNGAGECAVIAVENALAGAVNVSFDLLYQHNLYINGETRIRIEHALIAPPGGTLQDIRVAYSHPVALEQCRRFFIEHREIEQRPAYDTAGAVEMVIQDRAKYPNSAGIANRAAAEGYGGVVLLDNIEDSPDNFTRFFLVSREPRFPSTENRYKLSVLYVVDDAPGALVRSLRPFGDRAINIAKFENRPIKGTPFQYWFYLDALCEPGNHAAMDEALADLERASKTMRLLGRYRVYPYKENAQTKGGTNGSHDHPS